MFGISFSELLLVGLVALLVLGPERLPGAARTAGLWVGRLKRSFNAIKQEVEREIGADEIRRQLHNEHIQSLEQEARKILNPQGPTSPTAPVQPTPPVVPAAPTVDSAPATPPPPPPSAAPGSTLAPATPTGSAPAAPFANDATQPPRAP
jgi:sec-independent protein translocase protein TatB